MLVEFVNEYEQLYYRRRMDRLHFVRPCIHVLTHIVPEVIRVGPGALHTQWTLENYIGNITREIRQHVTPYANVAKRALRRCHINVLKAMFPDLHQADTIPFSARDLGDGYVLLHVTERSPYDVIDIEAITIHLHIPYRSTAGSRRILCKLVA